MSVRKTQSVATRTRKGFEPAGKFYRGLVTMGVIAVSFLLGATLDSQPAFAQRVCGLHTDIVKKLAKIHSEIPQAIGISSEGVSPNGSRSPCKSSTESGREGLMGVTASRI